MILCMLFPTVTISHGLLFPFCSVNDFSGGGTGFIGFDGNNVLLVTVYHVINSLDTAIRSTFYFQYLAESQQPVVVNGTDLFAGCTVSDYNLCPDKV